MPTVTANGIRLSYERAGSGPPVVLIMGSDASRRVWTMHTTPALNRAGYETIAFDNRGMPPSDAPEGKYALADLVEDTNGLIEALGVGPCLLLGTSMGSMIAQEILIQRPDLVQGAALMATRARADLVRQAMHRADVLMAESGVSLPAPYTAVTSVLQMFSPSTLNDDAGAATWLEIFELAGGTDGRRPNGQAWVWQDDRREQLRTVGVPCRVIAFGDDLICPPHLGAEVAEAIPDCDFLEIPRCGHLGYLERPDTVNQAVIEFFDKCR